MAHLCPCRRSRWRLGSRLRDLVTSAGLPCVASCGAPFVLVELASLAALARATLDARAELPSGAVGVHLFTRETDDAAVDLRARMFAPAHGVAEDPATGSAAAALAGYLAGRPNLADGWHAGASRRGSRWGGRA